MSTAFENQWLRTSSAKRLLTMLTVLAKEQPLTFTPEQLESALVGDAIRESFEGGKLVIRYIPKEVLNTTQTYVIEETRAVERSATWQPPQAHEPQTPSRLREVLEPQPPNAVNTLDDAEMARREQGYNQQTRFQREAAARRSQPLPITQPPIAPS